MCIFFFFKQKTAYEMRISDWSSDVCSSDLLVDRGVVDEAHAEAGGQLGQRSGELEAVTGLVAGQAQAADEFLRHAGQRRFHRDAAGPVEHGIAEPELVEHRHVGGGTVDLLRPGSAKRPEGKGCVLPWRTRRFPHT